MEADFGQRIKAAHERAAQLYADTARLVSMARQVLHVTRNTRHKIGLLRAARRAAGDMLSDDSYGVISRRR